MLDRFGKINSVILILIVYAGDSLTTQLCLMIVKCKIALSSNIIVSGHQNIKYARISIVKRMLHRYFQLLIKEETVVRKHYTTHDYGAKFSKIEGQVKSYMELSLL